MGRARLRKMKSLTLGHMANKGSSQDHESREFDYYSKNPRKDSAVG